MNTSSPANLCNRPDEDLFHLSGHRRAALHWLFALMVIAVLANGLYFWLQKSQLIESGAYQDYLTTLRSVDQTGGDFDHSAAKQVLRSGMLFIPKEWLPAKLAKDVLFLAFILVSFKFAATALPSIAGVRILPALFALLVTAAFFHSLIRYGPLPAAIGLRPYFFLPLILVAMWAVSGRALALLSRYLVIVLAIELLLAVYENFHGLPIYFSTRPGGRATGTFSLPASLGIFAAVVFVFAAQFNRFSRFNMMVLVMLSASVVYLSGSATAAVVLGISFAIQVLRAVPASWKTGVFMLLICALFFLVLSLPKLLSRPDVYDSLFGRVLSAENYARRQVSLSTIFLGQGLGVGSNVINSVNSHVRDPDLIAVIQVPRAVADSTPMALFHQLGALGVLVFYSMMGLAAWRDRQARPINLAIFLASMAVNTTELFPVNFLLGLLLCRSFMNERDLDSP